MLRAVMLGLLLTSSNASAADLILARPTEHSALDPLFSRTGNNGDTSQTMFDQLVEHDANNQMHPALALSWRNLDPLTWEITLRPDVVFHDGAKLIADDVMFSLERAKTATNSPASYAGAVRGIVGIEVVDPLTLRVRTSEPTPQLIEQIGIVYIMSRKAAEGVGMSAMNSGQGVVGTGPYRLVAWQPGQKLDLVRNPAYWHGTPAWEHVSLRFIPLATARVAALLAGDVDVIGEVGPSDVKQLHASGKAQIFSIASTRLIYLALVSVRAQSPFVTDMAGKPMERNPLADMRVRQAVSRLVDRNAIVTRLLDGSGEAAGQMVPEGLGGFDPRLTPPPVDVAGARKLLAEAGWGAGFGLTLHGSADRFAKDGALAQAVGQMLGRGGIKINAVQALPYATYVSAASRQEYSAFIFSFGTTTSNSAIALTNVLARYDAAAGMGMFNRARYSNPAFDTALNDALGTFDEPARNAKLHNATHIAITDGGIIPLYWPVVHWATRKGLTYTPRRDEATGPQYAHPSP
jgi:peptide/nickel transport system substrate-binding protein